MICSLGHFRIPSNIFESGLSFYDLSVCYTKFCIFIGYQKLKALNAHWDSEVSLEQLSVIIWFCFIQWFNVKYSIFCVASCKSIKEVYSLQMNHIAMQDWGFSHFLYSPYYCLHSVIFNQVFLSCRAIHTFPSLPYNAQGTHCPPMAWLYTLLAKPKLEP